MDDILLEILVKTPQYDVLTPFGIFLAEATKWARSDENDRIKCFCCHLAPNSLKIKVRENFGESFETFRRKIQAMWGCQDDMVPLVNNPVNYDSTRHHTCQYKLF